jgi:hypothetical protein
MDVQELNVTMEAAVAENPTGAWSGAPSLAATGVAMSNTSGYAVWADVVGGTVTAITVNGSNVGATNGSVRVPPRGTLAITYSAAPTVNWYFESTSTVKPAGVWAGAPSVAATTVAMVNTSGQNVIAYVSANGATIASIKRNSTVTGLITGPIRLRRGDSLTLAYTVATPAIVWMYE